MVSIQRGTSLAVLAASLAFAACGQSGDDSWSAAPEKDSAAGGDAPEVGDASPDGEGSVTVDAVAADQQCFTTCAELGAECGQVSDGCGKELDCGTCEAPESCGGGGEQRKCGCTPKTCAQLNASCGSIEDGCGHQIGCGDCPDGIYCGASGVPNQCGCACTLPHASTTCGAGGVCTIVACDQGWGNCDNDDSDGCEVNLQGSASNCGACGVVCDDANACTLGDACQSGKCVAGTPNPCNAPPNTECHLPVGTCNPSTGACSYQGRPDGTSCSAGYCCGKECVPRNSDANCGSCGIDCGSGSCVKISGLSQYSCTCTGGDAFCKSAGFGSAATCYNYGGQYLCDCQCQSSPCTGQCAGGGICTELMGHNYCHY